MLTVGEKFPAFELTAVVDLDLKNAFKTLTDQSFAGKWKVYFFWPKDFTFVCPTEIAAFGKLNPEFVSRDTGLPIKHKVKRRLTKRDEVQAYIEKSMKDAKDAKKDAKADLKKDAKPEAKSTKVEPKSATPSTGTTK